jgi:hypothetical protein
MFCLNCHQGLHSRVDPNGFSLARILLYEPSFNRNATIQRRRIENKPIDPLNIKNCCSLTSGMAKVHCSALPDADCLYNTVTCIHRHAPRLSNVPPTLQGLASSDASGDL